MSCTPPLHIPACFHTWTDSHVIVFGTSLYRFTSKDAYFYMINRSNTYLLHGEFSLLLKYSGKGITQNNMHIILPETCTNGKIASMPSPRTPSFLCPFQHQYSGLVSGPSKIEALIKQRRLLKLCTPSEFKLEKHHIHGGTNKIRPEIHGSSHKYI